MHPYVTSYWEGWRGIANMTNDGAGRRVGGVPECDVLFWWEGKGRGKA